VPQYEALMRRTVEANARAQSLRADARRISDLAQLLRDAHASRILLTRCAWCQRLKVGDQWLHLEGVGEGQTRIATSLAKNASHGICPDCFDREMERAARLRLQRGQPPHHRHP
jgi:hypothetical protein